MTRIATILFALLCLGPVVQAEDLYLAPYDGDGSDLTPFLPRGLDTGVSCIGLRPDPTKAAGVALCRASAMPAVAGLVPLSKALNDPLTAKVRTDIVTALGKSISVSSTTVPGILKELLVDSGKLVAGSDGKIQIYLGDQIPIYQKTGWVPFEDNGAVADLWNAQKRAVYLAYHYTVEPIVAWATTLATETWNCADNASLTCVLSWTEYNGTGWSIASSRAAVAVTGGNDARADSALASADHWAQATLISENSDAGGTARCGPTIRKDNTATRTFYGAAAVHSAGAYSQYETILRSGGTLTTLASNGTDPVNNDVVRIYASGSNISTYVNGVLRIGPTTDATIASNMYAGISYTSNASAVFDCKLDDWSASDLTSGQMGQFHRRIQ